MSSGAARFAALLWALVLASLLAFFVYGIARPTHNAGGGTILNALAYIAFVLAFATVGAILAGKRARNPIGWLLVAAALGYVVGGAGTSVDVSPDASLGPVVLLAWAGQWSWGLGVGFAVVALLLFPDGRLPSPRWWPALGCAVFGMSAFVLGAGFGAPTIGDGPVRNPFAISGALGGVLAALQAAFLLVLLAALLAVASIVVRFVRSVGAEREQVKWLLFAASLVALGLVAQVPISLLLSREDATNASNALLTATLACLPVAIGVAVLRYRLYDIDVVINRTLVYAALTGALGATYAVAVVASQAVLRPFTRGNELAVAASTVLVVALFQPLRRRIQSRVDRRFYRSRYDAARTLEAFSARLRDEVELDALRDDLLGVVSQTLRPTSASVWLRSERS